MSVEFDTITNVSSNIRSGNITSTALTELMLDRISRYNGRLNAYITVTADLARNQARQADEELKNGLDRGPLHGIPVAVKDLIETEGIRTTGGSRLFENHIPDQDATAVIQLKKSGCVLLGKTGLHELAYGHSSINPFFGSISNPWALDHDPGGSSGGSACAVAAGLAYAALGTDTGCSIRQPAHCCGIVGHKPTFGLVSKAGVLPLVWSMDHIGPLTRSVKDAAHLLDAIAGYDAADPYSVRTSDAAAFEMDACRLKDKRIGIIRRYFFDGYREVTEVVDKALDQLNQAGAILVELDVPDLNDAFEATKVMFAEALAFHQKDFQERPQDFSEEVSGKLKNSLNLTAADYAKAHHFRQEFRQRIDRLMMDIDVLAAPTATITAKPIHDRPDDYPVNAWKNTGIFDFTGQPSISIPCGFAASGLPVGMMITGRHFEDKKVLAIAAAVDKLLGTRRTPPGF